MTPRLTDVNPEPDHGAVSCCSRCWLPQVSGVQGLSGERRDRGLQAAGGSTHARSGTAQARGSDEEARSNDKEAPPLAANARGGHEAVVSAAGRAHDPAGPRRIAP